MQFINIVKLIVAVALFSGCANRYIKKPDFEFSEKTFKLECNNQSYTMVVGENGYSFAVFDALMVPIVQKSIHKNRLSNSKFLPPNSKFDALFIHTLKMIERAIFDFEFIDSKLNCKVKEI